jgi:hypothetical protein
MAEPACLAISSRKARSGSHRISKRHPASSHHKDRVHTLAPRPTRGIGFNGGTGGTKKRPACARRSASVALFGHTPTTTCRSVTIGQAIGQVRWSTAVDLPAVAAASGQSGHRSHCLDLCLQVVEALGRDVLRWSALGPWGIGNRWSPAGTSGQCRRTRIAGHRPVNRFDQGRRSSTGLGSNPTSFRLDWSLSDAVGGGLPVASGG